MAPPLIWVSFPTSSTAVSSASESYRYMAPPYTYVSLVCIEELTKEIDPDET